MPRYFPSSSLQCSRMFKHVHPTFQLPHYETYNPASSANAAFRSSIGPYKTLLQNCTKLMGLILRAGSINSHRKTSLQWGDVVHGLFATNSLLARIVTAQECSFTAALYQVIAPMQVQTLIKLVDPAPQSLLQLSGLLTSLLGQGLLQDPSLLASICRLRAYDLLFPSDTQCKVLERIIDVSMASIRIAPSLVS